MRPEPSQSERDLDRLVEAYERRAEEVRQQRIKDLASRVELGTRVRARLVHQPESRDAFGRWGRLAAADQSIGLYRCEMQALAEGRALQAAGGRR